MIKVKFLEPSYIYEKTQDVLKIAHKEGFYNFDEPTPLDLIAEIICDLQIGYHDLDKDIEGALGALDLENKVIWLDNSLDHTQTTEILDEGRCNFTIGHELGHFFLHKEICQNGNLIAFHNEMLKETRWAETQANMFGAMITMPPKLIIKKWNIDFLNIENQNERISALVDFFRVSRESMQYRLSDLDLLL